MKRTQGLGLLMTLAVLMSACGLFDKVSKPDKLISPEAAPTVRSEVSVVAQPSTNRGAVLHLMLTRVDPKGAAGSYDEEAARFAASPADESIVATRLVLPGQSLTIPIKVAADQAVAAAFFFTQPGASWRVVLPQPLPSRVSIVLGTDGVDTIEVPEREP